MFKSILASDHHFYLIFFESEQVRSAEDIIALIPEKKQSELIVCENQMSFIHLQVELDKPYGIESVLKANLSRKDGETSFFWYDFYLGEATIDKKKVYFICYLYSKLGKYLDRCFNKNMVKKTLYKSNVSTVLDYLEKGLSGYELEEKNGLIVSISRYSAQIIEKRESNKMNIIGANPLGSTVFKVLNSTEGVEVIPISLKLKFKSAGYFVQLAIDKIGNYRLWIYLDGQTHLLPIIPLIISFFGDIHSVNRSSFVNTNTLLEDDKEK